MNRSLLRTDHSRRDAEQIIEAIRTGCVDAFVIEDREGQTVYALQNADLPYNTLVQKMQQGAAMLNSNREIIYCNPGLANLLGLPADGIVGLQVQNFVEPGDRENLQKLLDALPLNPAEGELRLRRADGSLVPAKFSFSILAGDEPVIGVLISDLTTEKAHAELASRIQSVQDEERRGLARELHDSVGQLLAAVSMNLARFRSESPNRDPGLMALMEDTSVMVEQVSKEIRTISHLLHPPLLDVAGLSSAVRWYVRRILRAQQNQCRFGHPLGLRPPLQRNRNRRLPHGSGMPD